LLLLVVEAVVEEAEPPLLNPLGVEAEAVEI